MAWESSFLVALVCATARARRRRRRPVHSSNSQPISQKAFRNTCCRPHPNEAVIRSHCHAPDSSSTTPSDTTTRLHNPVVAVNKKTLYRPLSRPRPLPGPSLAIILAFKSILISPLVRNLTPVHLISAVPKRQLLQLLFSCPFQSTTKTIRL